MTLRFSNDFETTDNDLTIVMESPTTEDIEFPLTASTEPTPSTSRTPTPDLTKKRKRGKETEEELLLMIRDKMKEGAENESVIFGKFIGMNLPKLDKTQSSIAKKLIHDIMYYGEMGLLQHNVTIQNLKDPNISN